MIKIEYIYIYNDTKNTKSGSCVLCIIKLLYCILSFGAEVGYAVGMTGGDHGEHRVMCSSHRLSR